MTHGQVLVGLLIVLIAGPVPPTVSAADMQADQIARIEAQLEPSVQIYGRPIKAHTLSEAMAAHHTPAVSVAVVDNRISIWAKAGRPTRYDGCAHIFMGATCIAQPSSSGSIKKSWA